MLLNTILLASGEGLNGRYLTDNSNTECAYYPASNMLVVINNSNTTQNTSIETEGGKVTVEVEAYDTKIIEL